MSKLLKILLSLKESKSENIQPSVKPDKSLGIKTNWWAFITKLPVAGVESDVTKDKKETAGSTRKGDLPTPFDSWASRLAKSRKGQESGEGIEAANPVQAEDGEAKARKIIVDNPTISAPTLLNTLKSQGIEMVSKVEADAASSNGQVLRGETQESKNSIHINARFLEGTVKTDTIGWTRFRCVLLQEGMGNLKDAYYYSRQCLETAMPIFEGKKIYADHPTAIEDSTRPERSVKDVLGHFENVALVTDKESGQSMIEADLVILPDEPYRWARALLRHAVEYAKKFPDKDFVGLSINASGEAEAQPIDQVIESAPQGAKLKLMKAKDEQGISEVRVVSSISDAISCDLVTEAGAGGKILQLLEGEKMEKELDEGGPGSGPRKGGGKSDKDKATIRRQAALTKNQSGAANQSKVDAFSKANKAHNDFQKGMRLKYGHNDDERTYGLGDRLAKVMIPAEKTKHDKLKKDRLDTGSKVKKTDFKKVLNQKEGSEDLMSDDKENKDLAAMPEEAGPEVGDQTGHDDATQDMALIKKMIDQYLGGEEQGEDETAIAKEAYEAYSEMGYKEDEALQCAAHALKLAKHMSKKQSEAAAPDEEEVGDEETKPEGEEKQEECMDKKESDGEVKESEEKEETKESKKVLELSGKLAFAEAELKKAKFSGLLDSFCEKNKMPNEINKVFKTLVVEQKITTEAKIQEAWNIFSKGQEVAVGGRQKPNFDFAITTEKTTSTSSGKKEITFDDCLN